jgi:hypothetical protein
MPAHAVARRADAVPGELAVILPGQHVVPRRGQQVEPPPVGPAMGGAFEAAQEDAPRGVGAEERTGHCATCPRCRDAEEGGRREQASARREGRHRLISRPSGR